MLKIQTLDRPEVFTLGLQLGWLVGFLGKQTFLDGGRPRSRKPCNGDHDVKRRRAQGLEEACTMFLNLLVSEGIRPHQGCGVIHGHLVSANKPSILLWKLLVELSQICWRMQTPSYSPVELSILGCDLGICFILFLQEHNNHSFVGPLLCLHLSGKHFF